VTCAQSMAQGCSSGCTDSAMELQVKLDWCGAYVYQWQDQTIRPRVLNECSRRKRSWLNGMCVEG